jgi:DUF438 domain-containing protein
LKCNKSQQEVKNIYKNLMNKVITKVIKEIEVNLMNKKIKTKVVRVIQLFIIVSFMNIFKP